MDKQGWPQTACGVVLTEQAQPADPPVGSRVLEKHRVWGAHALHGPSSPGGCGRDARLVYAREHLLGGPRNLVPLLGLLGSQMACSGLRVAFLGPGWPLSPGVGTWELFLLPKQAAWGCRWGPRNWVLPPFSPGSQGVWERGSLRLLPGKVCEGAPDRGQEVGRGLGGALGAEPRVSPGRPALCPGLVPSEGSRHSAPACSGRLQAGGEPLGCRVWRGRHWPAWCPLE